MNEPCRHCGNRLHLSIECHQLKLGDSRLKPSELGPVYAKTGTIETTDSLKARADRVRQNLLQLGELLKRHDNHSGARAAEVLASVPQTDAMLFLERLFNESA